MLEKDTCSWPPPRFKENCTLAAGESLGGESNSWPLPIKLLSRHMKNWYVWRPEIFLQGCRSSSLLETNYMLITLVYLGVQQGVKRVPRRSLRPHLAAHIWKMMWAILYNQCNMSRIMNYLGAMIATLPRMKCYTQEAYRIILYASTRWTRLQTCNCLINEA